MMQALYRVSVGKVKDMAKHNSGQNQSIYSQYLSLKPDVAQLLIYASGLHSGDEKTNP